MLNQSIHQFFVVIVLHMRNIPFFSMLIFINEISKKNLLIFNVFFKENDQTENCREIKKYKIDVHQKYNPKILKVVILKLISIPVELLKI